MEKFDLRPIFTILIASSILALICTIVPSGNTINSRLARKFGTSSATFALVEQFVPVLTYMAIDLARIVFRR